MLTPDPTVWRRPIARFLKELKANETVRFSSTQNFDGLRLNLEFIRKNRRGLSSDVTWERTFKVVMLLEPLAEAADVLAKGICVPSNIILGALGLIIDCCGSKAETLDSVLYAYESLLSMLPSPSHTCTALNESDSLRCAIAEIFDAYITLSIRSLKTFGRSDRLSTLKTFVWMRDRKLFQDDLRRLEHLMQKARTEAGYALQEQRRVQDTQALQDAVRNTEEILSNLTINEHSSLSELERGPQNSTLPPKSSLFVGRMGEIEKIHSCLNPNGCDSDSSEQQRSVVICGLGGIGKTQLALEYADRFKHLYRCCFWINCESGVKISESFAEIGGLLGLPQAPFSQASYNVRKWLDKAELRCLIIFDNAESPSQMADHWPRSIHGGILVTTQDSGWLNQEFIDEGLRLDPLNDRDSTTLVQNLFRRKNKTVTHDEMSQLYHETGGLPLAIRQITSFVLAEGMEMDEFLTSYHDSRNAWTIDAWNESITPWYSHTLATYLNVAFAKLTPRAISLLIILSFLDVENVQEALLRNPCRSTNEGSHTFTNLQDFDPDVSRLYRYSLISKSRGAQGLRFSLHRQVKRHVITRSPTDALERGVSWVVQRLRQLFPRQSAFTGELDDTNHNCGEYINHVLALRDSFPILRRLTLEAESLASLFLDSGIYLWARGLTEDGKALTGLAEELCGTGHFAGQMSAQIYAFHASVLSDSGDNHDALEYFERSLVVLKGFLRSAQNRVLPSDEALLANAWNNLAGIHCALGNFDEAEMYNDMSLQLKQKLHNAGQPVSHLLCLSYSNIANTYALQGYYEEASKFFEKALEVGVTSDSLSRRALTSHNYGHMRLAQNMVEDARQLFENAYRLRIKKIGDHPDTAASLHMLASCYHRSGDVDNLLIARLLLRDCLRILKSLPFNHNQGRIARSTFKLAVVLEALQDSQAEEHREQAVTLFLKLTGASTPPTSESDFDELVSYI